MPILAEKNATPRPDLFCSMIDARRMEVYTAIYNADLEQIGDTRALVVDENSFAEELKTNTIAFYGDGADKCRSVITSANARFIDGICPLAANMVPLAEKAFAAADFKDVAYFDPF
jgi:tRNA threonylcarbamoyladenosine biosynthesis protein TsaB